MFPSFPWHYLREDDGRSSHSYSNFAHGDQRVAPLLQILGVALGKLTVTLRRWLAVSLE